MVVYWLVLVVMVIFINVVDREPQVLHIRRRNNAMSPTGIYRCDIETIAVNDTDVDTITGETLYIGLYPPSGGKYEDCQCNNPIFNFYNNYSHALTQHKKMLSIHFVDYANLLSLSLSLHGFKLCYS